MVFDGSIVYWKGDSEQKVWKVGNSQNVGCVECQAKELIQSNNQCYQFLSGLFLEPPD